ncbi:MAG: hypothetical protein HOG25_01140 [Gammaproteobacteria bacterium]|jgi:predicted Zn-dependent protease|nr:hypothetical protein [Gammaproteobacteria bacterium]
MRPILQTMLASISLYLPALSAHQGDHSSIAELDALLAISPDAPSLLMTRGAAYTRTGQWDKAEQDIRLAKQIDTHINVEFALAQLYFHSGAFNNALLHINQYIEINPGYAPALLLKARSAHAAKQTKLALQSWVDYLTMEPLAHPGDYLAAAKLHALTGASGLKKALDLIDQGIENIGLTAQLQGYAMQLELDRNQPTRAYNRWRSLEHQLGTTPKYKITLAKLLILTNRAGEARLMLEDARTQLLQLRKTPAREALDLKLLSIEKQLG